MDGATQEQVKTLLRGFMDTWIGKQYEELRSIGPDGSSPSGILAPFHDALVPGIRGLGERGFSTALGNLHERIALVVATSIHAGAQRAYDLSGRLPVLAREFVTQRLIQLSERRLARAPLRRLEVAPPAVGFSGLRFIADCVPRCRSGAEP